MDWCSEEGVVGSCCGKEEAEDRSVGSDRYRAVGSCRGKGEAEDRLWQIGGSVL